MKRERKTRRFSRVERLESRQLLVGELLAIELDVTQDGQSILDGNREFSVEVGERFDLEVSYDDLRSEFERKGAALFYSTIAASLPDSFRPVVVEGYTLRIDGNNQNLTGGDTVLGVEGQAETFTIPFLTSNGVPGFANDTDGAFQFAVESLLGLTSEQAKVNARITSNRIEVDVDLFGEDLALRDLPNLTLDTSGLMGAMVVSQVVEHPAFNNHDPSQGVNASRFRSSVDFHSKSLNGLEVYSSFPQSTFVKSDPTATFRSVGGLTTLTDLSAAAAMQGVTFTGQDFEAYSIRIEAVAPAMGLTFDAVYSTSGLDDITLFPDFANALSADQVLIDQGGLATVTGTFISVSPPFQNPASRFDVDNDGSTSLASALVDIDHIAEELAQRNVSDATTGQLPQSPSEPVTLFFDVNGDGFVTQQDIDDIRVEFFDLDFGDAPAAAQSGFASDYPTTLAQNGAAHVVGSLFLGSSVDAESDGIASANSDADDLDNDDEDGVVPITSILAGTTIPATIEVTASQSGKLDAWFDYNRDGVWDEATERVFANVDLSPGSNLLTFTPAAAASAGDVVARFRLSSNGVDAPTGIAADGEVEDHVVAVSDGSISADVHVAAGIASTIRLDGNQLVVNDASAERLRATLSDVTSLMVTSTDGVDIITLDYGGGSPVPGGGLTIDGAEDTDTLVVSGPALALDLTNSGSLLVRNFRNLDLSDPTPTVLSINAAAVVTLAPTEKTIRVVAQGDTSGDRDQIDFVDAVDWRMTDPIIENATEFVLVARNQISGETVEIVDPRSWQNPIHASDVNNNGSVSAVDALNVINELGRRLYSDTDTKQVVDPVSVSTWPGFYYDQNGDDRVTALDALRVINEMSRQLSAVSESETVAIVARDLSQTRNDRVIAAEERAISQPVRQATATSTWARTAGPADAHRSPVSSETRAPDAKAVDQLLSDESVW